jgi:hypothetical protein
LNKPTHFTVQHPYLRATYEAMQEIGLPEAVLNYETIQPLAVHLSEPDGNLETDNLPHLVRLLERIGMPFEVLADEKYPTLLISSDGLGYDWGNGSPDSPLMPAGGWRQRPTDTIDQVHLAALACSDAYWGVLPDRFKTPEAVVSWVTVLFRIESVWDLPRNRKALCERVWEIMLCTRAMKASAALDLHRMTLPVDALKAAKHLDAAKDIAYSLGCVHSDLVLTCYYSSCEPFLSEPILRRAWSRGFFDEGMRQSAEFEHDDELIEGATE